MKSPSGLTRGTFIYFNNQLLRITELVSGGMQFLAEDIETGHNVEFTLAELLSSENGYLVAKNEEELRARVKNAAATIQSPPRVGLSATLLEKARKIGHVLETVEKKLEENHDEVRLYGKRKVLEEILQDFDVCVATYYNWSKLYKKCHGDERLIAASFLRKKNLRLSKAQQDFLDTVIWDFRSLVPMDIYRVLRSLFSRTRGLWVDPVKCLSKLPEDLVAELKNPRIPIESILDNSVKMSLLSPIKLVSKSFFYEYLRDITSRPEIGKTLLDARWGEGTWDRQMKVFDTFRYLATQPLQCKSSSVMGHVKPEPENGSCRWRESW